MLKVDLGGIGRGGEWVTVNSDASVRSAPDHVADITAQANQLDSIFERGSIDIIRCVHTLEHLPQWDILPTLKYWREFLKTDGQLWIVVPDLGELARDYAGGHIPFEVFAAIAYVPPSRTINRPLTEIHRWGWDWASMVRDIEQAGYSDWKTSAAHKDSFNDVWVPTWTLDFEDLRHTGLVGKYQVPNLRVKAFK